MSFPPRPGDLPRADLESCANRAIAQFGGPKQVSVKFKFTCMHCGTRCTLSEPNVLYESGICCECGKETMILFGGFSLHCAI